MSFVLGKWYIIRLTIQILIFDIKQLLKLG